MNIYNCAFFSPFSFVATNLLVAFIVNNTRCSRQSPGGLYPVAYSPLFCNPAASYTKQFGNLKIVCQGLHYVFFAPMHTLAFTIYVCVCYSVVSNCCLLLLFIIVIIDIDCYCCIVIIDIIIIIVVVGIVEMLFYWSLPYFSLPAYIPLFPPHHHLLQRLWDVPVLRSDKRSCSPSTVSYVPAAPTEFSCAPKPCCLQYFICGWSILSDKKLRHLFSMFLHQKRDLFFSRHSVPSAVSSETVQRISEFIQRLFYIVCNALSTPPPYSARICMTAVSLSRRYWSSCLTLIRTTIKLFLFLLRYTSPSFLEPDSCVIPQYLPRVVYVPDPVIFHLYNAPRYSSTSLFHTLFTTRPPLLCGWLFCVLSSLMWKMIIITCNININGRWWFPLYYYYCCVLLCCSTFCRKSLLNICSLL